MTRYSVIRRTVVVGRRDRRRPLGAPRHSGGAGGRGLDPRLLGGHRAHPRLRRPVDALERDRGHPHRLHPAASPGRPGRGRYGGTGTVEEIGLIYTLLRTADGARFYVPNTRMASDTIRNATLQSFEHRAQITIGVPVGSDFERVRDILVEEARRAPEAMPDKNPVATLSQVDATAAVFTVEAWARSVGQAAKLASGLRVRRLQAASVRRDLRLMATNGTGSGNGNGPLYPAHRRRRRRQRRKREKVTSRRFAVLLALVVVLGTIAAFVAATVTGAAGILNNCDLASLKPVAIGANSFVYAADGTVLGAIPAERNRQPVGLDGMSHWVDERDGRRRGPPLLRARRHRLRGHRPRRGRERQERPHRPGRLDDHAAARPQPLHRQGGLPRPQDQGGLPRPEARGRAHEGLDPRELPEPGLLREPRLRRRGRGADLLLEARRRPQSRAGGADRRAPAGAVDLRPVPAPGRGGARGGTRCSAPCTRPATSRRSSTRARSQRRSSCMRGQHLHADPRAVLLQLRARGADRQVRSEHRARRRPQGLHDDRPAVPEARHPGDAEHAQLQDRPRLRARLDQPEERRDPGDDGRDPGKKNNQFNLAAQGRRQAGSSFKTFVLTEAIQEGINPDTTMYMSAPFHWQPDPSSEAWDVSTFDGSFYGPSSITQSTLRSDNSVYARLTLDLGPEKIVTLAHQMGIKTKLEPVASIGLGSNSVGVLEMASAYATIAAGGIYSEPMAIRKVVLPSGEVDRGAGWGRVKQKRVFSDGVAYQVARILKMNIQAGTGRRRQPGLRRGRQDGDDGRLRRRVVCRDHDDRLDGRLGRLSEREDPDDGGARDPCRRRHLPGDDLAPLHGRAFGEQPACATGRSRATRSCGSRSTASTSSSEHPRRRRSRPTRRSTTTATPPAADRRRRRPSRRRRRLTRAQAPASGALRLGRGRRLPAPLAAAVACAWPGDSLLTPDHTDGITRWSWLFLGFLVRGLSSRTSPRFSSSASGAPALVPVLAVAAAVQLAPLAAPLLLSTDAYTYWDYGRIGAVHGANPYADKPSAFPDDPAYERMGAELAGHDDRLRARLHARLGGPRGGRRTIRPAAAAGSTRRWAPSPCSSLTGAGRVPRDGTARSPPRSSAGTRCSPSTSRAEATTMRG